MSIKRIERIDQWYADLRDVIYAIQWAKQNHLETEWLDSFLEEYTNTQDPKLSIYHANREWDL